MKWTHFICTVYWYCMCVFQIRKEQSTRIHSQQEFVRQRSVPDLVNICYCAIIINVCFRACQYLRSLAPILNDYDGHWYPGMYFLSILVWLRGKDPEKTSNMKTDPTGDETRACWVRGNDVTALVVVHCSNLISINCLRLSHPESLLLLNTSFRLLGCGLFSLSSDISLAAISDTWLPELRKTVKKQTRKDLLSIYGSLANH